MAEEEKIQTRKDEEYRLADLIVANSDYVRQTFLDNGISHSKVVSVPTGCPPVEQSPARSGNGSGPLRFLYAGTVSLRKGFLYLLDAWRRTKLGAGAELWIAGSLELAILGEMGGTVGMHYRGALPKSELQNAYRQSDVLVLPTLCEGLAHVVLEAISFGLPVITTEASGAGRLVVHGENGFIVPEGDAEALAGALTDALSRRKDLPSMGARSAELAANWTVSDSNAEHLRVLRMFLAERG